MGTIFIQTTTQFEVPVPAGLGEPQLAGAVESREDKPGARTASASSWMILDSSLPIRPQPSHLKNGTLFSHLKSMSKASSNSKSLNVPFVCLAAMEIQGFGELASL